MNYQLDYHVCLLYKFDKLQTGINSEKTEVKN